MAATLKWGSDLYKGFKFDKNDMLSMGDVADLKPFHMLSLEEKTPSWIKAVADFYDMVGWSNVSKKIPGIRKNYAMRQGTLVASDYIINPEVNPFSEVVGWVGGQQDQSPLRQFYPIAPNFVDVLRGEYVKMDNTWTVDVIDPQSQAEKFRFKEEQFRDTIMELAGLQQQEAMARMGLTEETDPEAYQQQMQSVMRRLSEIELKAKNYRTTAQIWAEKVLKIHDKRYNLHELAPDAFETGLITDSVFMHIDLLEDDFKVDNINVMYADYHKGPDVKYVSEGDYFLWFQFMSTGDIINKFGRKLKEEDLDKLKEVYHKTMNLMVPDQLKNRQGAYYDLTKPWAEATDLNPVRNDAYLGRELAANYRQNGNFEHNLDVDILANGPTMERQSDPQMFRVMRLYWRSFRKVGWLTKILRDGTVIEPQWVDENFKATVKPVYDKSVVKEENKDNLLYGEHIDWTWAVEWRHVMKIAANHKHTFWANKENNYESIYIDGGPVKFQFKGKDNPFDSLPPVEGCTFSYINSEPHSFIDRIKGYQIIHNICMNKVPTKFLEDKGNKIFMDRRMMAGYDPSNQSANVDIIEDYENKLDSGNIVDYTIDRGALEGMGNPGLPHMIQMSTVNEADFYLNMADKIKWMAAESIGITRQRMGGQKASETAYGIEAGIQYSETQTSKYFEQQANFMQRFRQRMLDAAQYYSTFHETARETYMNDRDENVFLDIEGMENLLPHYNIHLQSRANVRAALQKISNFLQNDNTLPIKTSDKIEAMVENSLPKIFQLVKEGELELEQQQAAREAQEMEMRQKEMENAANMQKEALAFEAEQAQLDRDSQEEIALLRALGGVQTDADADGGIDAQQNIDAHFRLQELQEKRKSRQDDTEFKRQSEQQRIQLEREKAQLKFKGDVYKADKTLEVAKENKPPRPPARKK